MPTFDDNIKTIKNAVYGKEMRPAIAEALNQSKDTLEIMISAVDSLGKRVDSLPGGGGDSPDPGGGGDSPSGCYIVNDAIRSIDGSVTDFVSAGDATPI